MTTKNKSQESFFENLEVYPQIKIAYPEKPNRMWAFPLFGFLLKILILIPVFIWLCLISIFSLFVVIINSFIVSLTGEYWDYCFNLNVGIMTLWSKVMFFFAGLTDRYPGFGFKSEDFTLDIEKPKNPSRLLAFPILGFLVRIILLIPFGIYSTIINNAARIGVVVSSVPVFFAGKYPQGTYELTVDATRLTFAQISYLVGIKDNYPSFKIDLKNNRGLKLILIILATLIFLSRIGEGHRSKSFYMRDYQNFNDNKYQNKYTPSLPKDQGYN